MDIIESCVQYERQHTSLHYYYFYSICNLFKIVICKHIIMTDIAGSPEQLLLDFDINHNASPDVDETKQICMHWRILSFAFYFKLSAVHGGFALSSIVRNWEGKWRIEYLFPHIICIVCVFFLFTAKRQTVKGPK